MTVTVFGMGYVGSITLAALSSFGHKVCGVEIDKDKLAILRAGDTPVNEPGVKELLKKGIAKGLISFSSSTEEALQNSSAAIICVGTPSSANGKVNLDIINRCIKQIVSSAADDGMIIAIRSTVPPDYIETYLKPYLSAQDVMIPENISIISNPEFLREGSALKDFFNPPFIIFGKSDPDVEITSYVNLFEKIETENIITSFKTAFMVKYASNVFHAMKATFTNEIGLISEKIGAEMTEVMNIFCKDKQLNISKKYMKQGYAIGGSCLPKDLRALLYIANSGNVSLPLLEAIQYSNKNLIDITVSKLLRTGKNKFGFYGITFKQYTDDLRESPFVKTIELLSEENKQIYIYDNDIIIENLNGTNKTIFQNLIENKNISFVRNTGELFDLSDILILTKENIDVIKKYIDNQKIIVMDLSVGRVLIKEKFENLKLI